MAHRFVEHTADVMVEIWGKTWEEVFAEAARAMFEVMVDVDKVRPAEERVVRAEGEDVEHLLYNFLNEFLVLKDAEGLIFSEFDVKIDGLRAECVARGEKIRPEHNPRADVKAVTMHMFEAEEKGGKKYARIIFDV